MQKAPHHAHTQPSPAVFTNAELLRVQAKLPDSNRGQNRLSAAMMRFLQWSQEEGWAFARKRLVWGSHNQIDNRIDFTIFHRKKRGKEMQHIVFLGSYLYKTPGPWYP